MSVGSAYAIRSGVGTASVAALGVLFMGESVTEAKAAGIVLVIAGVVLLNLGGVTHRGRGTERWRAPSRPLPPLRQAWSGRC